MRVSKYIAAVALAIVGLALSARAQEVTPGGSNSIIGLADGGVIQGPGTALVPSGGVLTTIPGTAQTASTTLNTLNQTLVLPLAGAQAPVFQLTAISAGTMTILADPSWDNCTTFNTTTNMYFLGMTVSTGEVTALIANAGTNPIDTYSIDLTSNTYPSFAASIYPNCVRLRVSAYTSGSVTGTLNAIVMNNNQSVVSIQGGNFHNMITVVGGLNGSAVPVPTTVLATNSSNTSAASNAMLVLPGIAESSVQALTATRYAAPSIALNGDLYTETCIGVTCALVTGNNVTAIGNGMQVMPARASASGVVTSGDAELLNINPNNGALFTQLVGTSTLPINSATDNSTATATGLQVMPARYATSPTAGTTGDLALLQQDAATGGLFDVPIPTTAAGAALTPVVIAVNTTSSVKGSAGNVYGISAVNPAATVCYVQFYNTNAPTCGTSVVWSLAIPATGVLNYPPGPMPLANFGTSIGTCFSTTQTGAVTCTGTVSETIFVK